MNGQIGHSRQHYRPLSMPVALVGPPYVPGLPSWNTGGTRILCAVKHTGKPEFLWGQNTFGYTLVFCKIPFFSLLLWLLFRFAYVITITLRLLSTQRSSLVFSSARPFAFTYITFLCHHFALWLRNLQRFFLPFLPPGPLDAVLRKSWRSSQLHWAVISTSACRYCYRVELELRIDPVSVWETMPCLLP